MSFRITFVLDLFKGPQEEFLSHKVLQLMLDNLYAVDCLFLEANPYTPRIYSPNLITRKPRIHYEQEEVGVEDWQDIPTTLARGIGDCLPLDTLVMRDDYTFCPIGELVPGDIIMGDGVLTKVTDTAVTGEKPLLAFDLDNGSTLRCSPEHRLFLQNGEEIRAGAVKVGDRLKSPSSIPCMQAPWPCGPHSSRSWQVKGIRELEPEVCCDITTDTGRFYLPESDLVVHNCEDLACWRAAELTVLEKIPARPTFTVKKRANGGMLYHILVKRLDDGSLEDPSRKLGM